MSITFVQPILGTSNSGAITNSTAPYLKPLSILKALTCFVILAFNLSYSAQAQIISDKEIKLLVDSIDVALNRLYVYPDKAAKMAQKVKANYKNGTYTKISNRSELGTRILADLQQVNKDLHLKVGYFPEMANAFEDPRRDSIAKQSYEQRLNEARASNFSLRKREILPGNIGYLLWDAFDAFVEEALPVYDSAFLFVSKCNALIIDMRYNQGGRADMEFALQNYFFEKRTTLNHLIERWNDTIKIYTDPEKTSFKLKMPLYILTSHTTFSAGEDFTYALQQTGRATIVGEVTGGGAHPVSYTSLGQGFMLAVPTRRSYNEISKTNWEGTGITPDIKEDADEAYTKTLLLIYEKFLASAKSDSEKKSIEGFIAAAKQKKHLALPLGTLKNTDAKNAILIKDSIYGPVNVNRSGGSLMELHRKTGFMIRNKVIFLSETNSAWYKLVFDHDTMLTFDIVPIDPTNDYDFMIFKCPGENCIENIKSGKVVPDRLCFSGFSSFNGATGISEHATQVYAEIGPGATHLRAIPVKAGDVYYLMVDFNEDYLKEGKESSGFTIYFHNYWSKKRPVTLENVNFNSNETVLLKESFPELDKLAEHLKKNKDQNIEIRGHADSQGDEEKNIELSVSRANAVKEYLVSKGINAKRISCKGFGSSKPLTKDDSKEGRKKNRRVEMAIILK